MKNTNYTYDIIFNDESNSNNLGFRSTLEYCKDYIKMHNGTDHGYFNDYKGGSVSIYCNETEIDVYEEVVF